MPERITAGRAAGAGSVLVAAADAISGSRPGARRKTLVDYAKRIEKLEGIANSYEGVEQSYAIQAGREIRVIAVPEKIDDAQVSLLANEQWDEWEGSELSGVKAKLSPRAPLSRALRSPLCDLLRRFLI